MTARRASLQPTSGAAPNFESEVISDWDASFEGHDIVHGDYPMSGNPSAMDQYLDQRGLFRYHLPADGSCLFRAVSEVLFGCQAKHAAVRMSCCDYISKHRARLAGKFDISGNLDDYIDRLRECQFPGGRTEMHVLSEMYKVDFLVFYRHGIDPVPITREVHDTKIYLCWATQSQYDLVYTKEHIEALRITQAIVYDVLYKDVFELGSNEVDFAVNQMLYEKDNFKNKRHLTFTQWCNSVLDGQERNITGLPENKGEQIVLSVRHGVPPFPFKVAKCLDPKILRNVDYLNWCEEKRDEYRTGMLVTPALDTGVKCIAKYAMKEHVGFVQSIDNNASTARVFLQTIGEIRTIPLSHLVSSPVSKNKASARMPAQEDEEFQQPLITTPYQKTRRSYSTGDTAITSEQFEGLLKKHSNRQKESPPKLGGIPENERRESSHGGHHTDEKHYRNHGRNNARKFSLPLASTPSKPSPVPPQPTSFVPLSPIQLPQTSVDATCTYQIAQGQPMQTAYSPNSSFINHPADYSVVQSFRMIVPSFNPSIPPPNYQGVPSEPNDVVENLIIEYGFSFPPPPTGLDLSAFVREYSESGELPYSRVDILRYFFNLGVSVYRMRKGADESIANDSLLAPGNQVMRQNAYPVASYVPTYTIPQQAGIVYAPGYQTPTYYYPAPPPLPPQQPATMTDVQMYHHQQMNNPAPAMVANAQVN